MLPGFLRALFPHPLKGATRTILIVTVIAHLLMLGMIHADGNAAIAVFLNLALVPSGIIHGKVWMFLTYMFLHDPTSLWHIIFNMFGLYILGPYVERILGWRRFTALYFISGFVGALTFTGWGLTLGNPDIPAIGASAGVMGVLVAFALLYPHAKLYLYFLVPIEARRLIPLAIGIDLIFALAGSHIAWQAHWGGMLGAWLYLRRPWTPQYMRAWKRKISLITGVGRPF